MSHETLEAALVRLVNTYFQRGLEPKEILAVKYIQSRLGREVIRFVRDLHPPASGPVTLVPGPPPRKAPKPREDPMTAFRRRIHESLKRHA